MPTIFTHPAIPLAIGMGLGKNIIPARLLLAGVAVSILPDLDVIAFKLHIAYASDFGHRGITHSLMLALLVALCASALARYFQASFGKSLGFLFVAMASHGVLDALTTGGLGVAFFWPFSSERYFFPEQVIKVSPIGTDHLLSERFLLVLQSELMWVWLPALLVLIALRVAARWRQPLSQTAA